MLMCVSSKGSTVRCRGTLFTPLEKISPDLRRWWGFGGQHDVQEQSGRLGVGVAVGAVLGGGLHLIARDTTFACSLHRNWFALWSGGGFDGLKAYRAELVVLLIGVAILTVPPVLAWLRRFVRSWWAGIASLVPILAACWTMLALNYGSAHKILAAGLGLLLLAALLAAELRQRFKKSAPRTSGDMRLSIPLPERGQPPKRRWQARANDDAITKFEDDIIGRAAVVELLASHALVQRTPIVALHGGLGDGKSSVLNLLREAIGHQAIVVSFSAWLPGSEASLATDLFRDIATECEKHFLVPHLRSRTRAFARVAGGSVGFLAGLKELFPAHSQKEDIQELHGALRRVPKPVLVLLDEIDRMQKDELTVLLKILRGAASIPNVTFVCAFSEEELIKQLEKDRPLSYGYLEKFFPVSVRLSPPAADLVGTCFIAGLQDRLLQQGWFNTSEDADRFVQQLEEIWTDSLVSICTNLRKVALLTNDIVAAGEPITREVNPVDLVLIEAVRRFSPSVYDLVRRGAEFLADAPKSPYLDRDKVTKESFVALNEEIDGFREAKSIKVLLCWLFGNYAKNSDQRAAFATQARRATGHYSPADEKRISDRDYFPIYFRGAVPEEMFSQAELDSVLSELAKAEADAQVDIAYIKLLGSIPAGQAKRRDALWKLARASETLSDTTAERLAYAAAKHADAFSYGLFSSSESVYALNIVFVAAQKASSTNPQRVLSGSMARTSNDAFAVRLLELTENRENNSILTNFARVDVAGLVGAFMDRMRRRYGRDSSGEMPDLKQADLWAFRRWAEYSEKDRETEQDFWRRFIGTSRKKLAQAINFIFPGDGVWTEDPRPILDKLFPLEELHDLLNKLPAGEELDDAEKGGIRRLEELRDGRFRTGFPWGTNAGQPEAPQ